MCKRYKTCHRPVDPRYKKFGVCSACYQWAHKWSTAKPSKLYKYIDKYEMQSERIESTLVVKKRRAS